jgi:hypothetical protein
VKMCAGQRKKVTNKEAATCCGRVCVASVGPVRGAPVPPLARGTRQGEVETKKKRVAAGGPLALALRRDGTRLDVAPCTCGSEFPSAATPAAHKQT